MRKHRIVSVLLAVCLMLSLAVVFTACEGGEANQPTGGTTAGTAAAYPPLPCR